MAFGTAAKAWLNRLLAHGNLRIDTLTAERVESARVHALDRKGHFDGPVLPILKGFAEFDARPLLRAAAAARDRTDRFLDPAGGGYCYANDYFTSPDAEIAYVLTNRLKPKRIIEVGSGNSTRLFRAAIRDGGLTTELVSIDPVPRVDILDFADRVRQERLEDVPVGFFTGQLDRDDVLFIDSSHEVRFGNDVLELMLKIVPALKPGVVIHIHDIFLPYEYPRGWIVDFKWDWREQYLVQAMLQGSDQFEVLWPGYFLQRTLADFASSFDARALRTAQSLWLRKIA